MFLGTYYPNLIGKGRLALPKKVRQELGSQKMVLTIGFDECIFGFREKDWQEVVRPELSRPLFSDKEGRKLRRRMCADALVVKLDSQGRFIIPKNMLEFAQIGKSLTLIGAGDHFEIWDSQKWQEYTKGI